MRQLRFRMASREDAPEIVALMNATFRTPIDTATWEWYVYNNPIAPSRVYLALEPDSDAICGAVGFAPIQLRMNGVVIPGDYAHHLAIKPAYRDTLSYLALLGYSLKGQAEGSTKLAIGPPNRTAYPIHKTLMKWVDFGFLDCVRKLAPQGQTHTCEELKTFPDEFDRFYARISKGLSFCVEKTTAWMNWRFCRRPGSPYTVYASWTNKEFAGYIVLKRWREPNGYRKVHIIDFHAMNEEALSKLIAAAECFAAGSDELNVWAVRGDPYRACLEAMGFAASHRQPLLARSYDRSPILYPDGACSLSYGDGDSLY